MSAPDLPDENRIKMADVVDRVGCEMKSVIEDPKYPHDKKLDAHVKSFEGSARKKLAAESGKAPADDEVKKEARRMYDDAPQYQHYQRGNFLLITAAAFELVLQVKDSGNVGSPSTATWSGIPVELGLFSIRLNGGISGTARRTATYKVSLYMRDILEWPSAQRCDALQTTSDTGIRLSGNFGVSEWITRAVETTIDTQTVDRFTSAGTTLQFTLTPSIGVTPTWNIVRPTGRKFDGTFTVGGQRDYDNKIDVVLTKVAASGPTRVVVTNWPPGFPSIARSPEAVAPRPPTSRPRRPTGEVDPATQYNLDKALDRLQIQGLPLFER
jgi:hypothetical protein